MYVCCPTYMFSLLTNEEIDQHNSPDTIIKKGIENISQNIHTTIAKYDYVPPELVTSFITNK